MATVTEKTPEPILTSSVADSSPLANNFNFIRLCLAVLVILDHCFEIVDGNRDREPLTRLFHTLSLGELSVDGFFILSGYLIVKSWSRHPELLPYFKKRVYRIYPGFIAASLVSAFIVGPLGSNAPAYFAAFDPVSFIFCMLLLFEPAVPPVFAGLHHALVNGSMWSIAYEFRCYVAVALFGMLGANKSKWTWLGITIATVAISYVPASVYNALHSNLLELILGQPDQFFRLAALFAAGATFYEFRDSIRYTTKYALAALAVLIVGLFFRYAVEIVLATAGAYVFFWLGFKHFPGLQWHRKWPDISYGVYLYGWPSQILLLWWFRNIGPYLLFPSALVLTFACAWLSWRLVESPFMARKPE